MLEKRAQGRPRRGTGEVGRSKIIESVRDLLRSEVSTDFSRKNLAQKIGVTPALITYYFPKKESLLEEVTAPVLRWYSEELRKIVAADASYEVRLRKMISLLLVIYGKDAKILQAYTLLRQTCILGVANEVQEITSILSDFFFEWRGDEISRSFDGAVLQGAVRGMCEFAARAEAANRGPAIDGCPDEDSRWLEPLFRLFASRLDHFATAFAGPNPAPA